MEADLRPGNVAIPPISGCLTIVNEVVQPVFEGRTVQAGFKAFEIHWENNVSVSLPPITMMPPAGPCPRITRFSKDLRNHLETNVLGDAGRTGIRISKGWDAKWRVEGKGPGVLPSASQGFEVFEPILL